MQLNDDTPTPGFIPDVYPSQPPINLIHEVELLNPNNFYAFEGIDGSGKSTLIRAVSESLANSGIETITAKLVGSDIVLHAIERAKWLNVDPICFNLLNWVSVFHQINMNKEFLNTPRLLLADRFTMTIKTRGFLEGLQNDYMDILEKMIPRPTAFFLLDCEPELCVERILTSKRQITYFESGARHVSMPNEQMVERSKWERTNTVTREKMLLQSLTRTRQHFLSLAKQYSNVIIIDNSCSIEHAVNQVVDVLIR